MPLKKPHVIRTLSVSEINQVNENWDRLYKVKLESRFHTVDSGVVSHIFQSMETGRTDFSATGSATVAKTISFKEKQNTILFVNAHALSTLVRAVVTNVTQSALTITCITVSGTANFSDVTTDSIRVFYQIIGGNS